MLIASAGSGFPHRVIGGVYPMLRSAHANSIEMKSVSDAQTTRLDLFVRLWRDTSLIVIATVTAAALFAGGYYMLAAVGFPYPIDYGEGGVLAASLDLARGDALYPPFHEPPYTMQNYPPTFLALSSLFDMIVPTDGLTSGRILSLICTSLCAVLVGWICFQIITADRALRWGGAVAAGAIFLHAAPTVEWGALMRVDMFALASALGGLGVYLYRGDKFRGLFLAGLFFLLAGLTKPTVLAALAAVCVYEFFLRPKRAIGFAISVIAFVVAYILVADWATSGWFSKHVVFGNAAGDWHWHLGFWYIEVFAQSQPLFILFAAIATVLVGGRFVGRAWAQKQNLLRLSDTRSTVNPVELIVIYFVLSLLTALTSSRMGSNVNYLLELATATAILGAASAVWLIQNAKTLLSQLGPLRSGLIIASLSTVVLWQATSTMSQRNAYKELLTVLAPSNDLYQSASAIVPLLREAPGMIWSDERAFSALAGKNVYFEFHDGSELVRTGEIDLGPILDDIRRQAFSVVVLRTSLADFERRLSTAEARGMLDRRLLLAFAEHYAPTQQVGEFTVFKAKDVEHSNRSDLVE